MKLFIAFIIGAIASCLILIFIDEKLATNIQSIATAITALTVIVGLYQFLQGKQTLKSNHNWNRRQLAMQESVRIMKEIKEIHEQYDDKLKYTERRHNEPYLVDADDGISGIHDLILAVDEHNSRIQARGVFCLSEDGRKLASAIKNILNNYEYLAAGIAEKTLDEKTIKRLSKSNIIKAYKVFGLYIDHLRDYHKRPLLYCELEKIAKRWIEEDSKPTTDRPGSEDEE